MKILTLLDYYEPGYRAGGPIRTLSNMISRLSDTYTFRVVTRDRDLGFSESYPGIRINKWHCVGKARVFYASPARHLCALLHFLRENSCEVLYLNSFFSWRSCILPLILLRCGYARNVPVVLAPRGALSPAALELKKTKKRLYIIAAKAIGLFDRVTFQASSKDEEDDIRCFLKSEKEQVIVAPNLLPALKETGQGSNINLSRPRQPGPLRLVFLSRISPMKNLDFLLRILGNVDAQLSLDIYGPTENLQYWRACSRLILDLPDCIQVRYRGNVSPDKVANKFAEYDLFVFPTRGENFGHVIFESLAAGTPVLLSNTTPWRADANGAIETIELKNLDAWRNAITWWSQADEKTLVLRRRAAHAYAVNACASDQALEQNRRLFETVCGFNKTPPVSQP